MSLYNLKGKLMKSFQTKSGNTPFDITATKNGDLVYAENKERTVKIDSGGYQATGLESSECLL